MKKTTKLLLGLMFTLAFVFVFFNAEAPAAFATSTAPTPGAGGTYTGSAYDLVDPLNPGIPDTNAYPGSYMEYRVSVNSGTPSTWSSALPSTVTNAGSYTVDWQVSGGTPASSETGSFTVTINPAPAPLPIAATPSAYTGNKQNLINPSSLDTTNFTYKFTINTVDAGSNYTATDANDYEIYVEIIPNSTNYASTYTSSNPYKLPNKVTIPKATITGITAPIANTPLEEDGSPKQLVLAGNPNGFTMEYSLDSGFSIKETDPKKITKTVAGTYQVYWRVIGNNNYNNDPGGYVNVTINPTTKPVVTINVGPQGNTTQSFVYDGLAHSLAATDYTWTYKNATGLSVSAVVNTNVSIADVGTVYVNVSSVTVTDASGKVLTAGTDYYLNVNPCNITVTKLPIIVTAKSGNRMVNGKPYELNAVTVTVKNASGNMPSGHTPVAVVEARDTSGALVTPINIGTYRNVIKSVSIIDGNKKDVTSNYDIQLLEGVLNLTATNGNPQTADVNDLTLWATLLAVSAVAVICIAVVFYVRTRKPKEN